MKTFKVLTIIFLGSLFIACGGSSTQKNNFSIQTNTENNAIQLGKTLELKLKNPKNIKVSSVSYTLDGNPIQPSSLIQDFKLGEHDLQATITYDGDTETVTQKLSVLNDTAPKILSYEIVNSYPHDITSYTQGLEFYNGTLYESTGQYGDSKLRTLDYKAGTVTKNVPLAKEYFGEGLTVLNNNVYLLTWLEGTGFVYDAETLERKSSFKYGESKEGWGLCNDNTTLYKSDGTSHIWLLNPDTLVEKDHIQVFTNRGKIGRLNELEWINGKIYANIYQKDGVVIINPKNGATEAVIDFSPLKKLVTQHQGLDVLNGIAYNPDTETIFVTGKRWDKLFEVRITEK
jgi:glutaminyl-peptide cyclotransferase